MSGAEPIVRALNGHWYGRYGIACCPAHSNTRTPALSLSDGGDGRLLLKCHAGCSFFAVLDALKGLGLVNGTGTQPRAADLERIQATREEQAGRREAQALTCWRESVPVHGTLAETYLRGRGITCDLPDTLRFHNACWHASASRFPALIAMVDGTEGFAIHRTYLRTDGLGKAAVDPPKAMLGSVMGGAVRLSEGAGRLVVAEGIETALSLLCRLLDGPVTVWAALSASGINGLSLPPQPGRLTIASDGDKAGRDAAHALAVRAHALGWSVSLCPAPDGRDWNDILQGKVVTS